MAAQLTVFMALVMLLPAAQASRRVALVIGNAAYANAPLTNPVNDAADLAAALRRLGFEVLERRNRNADEMRRDLADFQDKLQTGATGLFYFAGHGVQSARGRNYLLPVGVDYRRERDAELYGMEAGHVLHRMEEAGAGISIIILDACRDSPLPPEARSLGSRGLGRMEAPSGSLIAFSTSPGRTADENRSGRNGLYTEHLLRAIETPGLRLEDVFQRVRVDVERASKRTQSPEEISKLTSVFYFRPADSVLTPPAGDANNNVNLSDLQREAQARREWLEWQGRMRADFDRVSAFQGTADLRAQAWERFLRAWAQDNPLGTDDEGLRARARQALADAQLAAAGTPGPWGSTAAGSQSIGVNLTPPMAFGSTPSGTVALAGTLAKIKASGSVTVGVRESASVLSYASREGRYTGFHVELCRRVLEDVQRALGLDRLDIRYQPVTSQNRIPLVQNGTVDIECGATTNNQLRQREVAFAVTTFVEELRMAVRADSGITSVTQLAGRSVAFTTGTTSAQLLRQHPGTAGLTFREVFGKDHADSLAMLESGRADAFVMDSLILATHIARSPNPAVYRIVGEVLSQEPLAIMLRKDDVDFKNMVDNSLVAMMRSAEMQRIYDRSMMQPVQASNRPAALPIGAATRAAWTSPNDRPLESYRQ